VKKVKATKKAVRAVKKKATPVKKASMKFPPVTAEELLSAACEFDLGPEPLLMGNYKWYEKYPKESRQHHVYVRNMGNNNDDGPDRWGIFRDGRSVCLDKKGEWLWQSMPSSRTDDFYEQCRYASVHEAIGYYRLWHAAICKWAEEKLKAAKQDEKVILNYEDCPNIPKFK
jgi:hypothetical protein